MSINIYSRPVSNQSGVQDQRVHGLYDMFWTCKSSLFSNENFRYIFSLTDKNGQQLQTKTIPYTDGTGVFNSSQLTKNLLNYTFQPTIINTNYQTCNADIANFQVSVREYDTTNGYGALVDMTSGTTIRCKDENFNFQNFLLSSSRSRFLTNFNSDLTVYPNQQQTVRFLNGTFNTSYNSNYHSSAPILFVYVYSKIGALRVFVLGNPYYQIAPTNYPYNGSSSIRDYGEWLLEIGVGPYNLNKSQKLELVGNSFVVRNGVTIIDDNTSYYTIGFKNSLLFGYYTSEVLRFDMGCLNDEYNYIQFAWENIYGATDYYTATLFNKESYSSEKTNFYKYRYKLTNSYMNKINYSGGEETIKSNITKGYSVITDYLTETQCKELAYMWVSENVMANIDGTWYRIQLDDSDIVIGNNQGNGLNQYEINFHLSNKIIF